MNQVVRDHLNREDGRLEGRLQERMEIAREMNISERVMIEQLMQKFDLTKEKVVEYIEKRNK